MTSYVKELCKGKFYICQEKVRDFQNPLAVATMLISENDKHCRYPRKAIIVCQLLSEWLNLDMLSLESISVRTTFHEEIKMPELLQTLLFKL